MPLSIREAYRHCQRCGQELDGGDGIGPAKCGRCGYSHHFNPITAVGVVLHSGDQVLLIRRGRDPGKGKLGLPGGFVDLGERAEEAAVREIREELGLEIGELEFIATFVNHYEYQGISIPIVDIFFASSVDGDAAEFTLEEDEVSEAIWTPVRPDVLEQIAFCSNAQALEHWNSRRNQR